MPSEDAVAAWMTAVTVALAELKLSLGRKNSDAAAALLKLAEFEKARAEADKAKFEAEKAAEKARQEASKTALEMHKADLEAKKVENAASKAAGSERLMAIGRALSHLSSNTAVMTTIQTVVLAILGWLGLYFFGVPVPAGPTTAPIPVQAPGVPDAAP